MASKTTQKFRHLLLQKAIDLVNDSGIKILLFNTSYTPNATHDFVDSITGGTSKELSGTGYAGGFGGSGRKALASRALVRDDGSVKVYFDATDPTWSGLNAGTIGGAALCKEVTTDADSPLLVLFDPADLVTNGSDVTLVLPADGAANLT
jgi:hypothetical protein